MRVLWLAILVVMTSPAFADDVVVPAGRQILTPTHTEIGRGGGVVVAHVERLAEARRPGELRFRDTATPEIVPIAPGLEVYLLPPGPAAELILVDDGRSVLDVVRGRDPHPVLAAPRVVAVRSEQLVGRSHHTYTSVTARLATATPLHAAALVVFRADASVPSHRVPLSWTIAEADDDEVEIYLEVTPCHHDEPRPGDHLVFAWLDTAGQLSPTSGELVVASPLP